MARLHATSDLRGAIVIGRCLGLLAMVILAGCGSASSTVTPVASQALVTPTASSAIAGSQATTDDITAAMPYHLDFPDGWTRADPKNDDWEAFLADLRTKDPAYAQQLADAVSQSTSGFAAYETGSKEPFTPNVSCLTVDVAGEAPGTVLDEAEQQDAAIAKLPNIVGAPASDRIMLRVGETVRIRWRWTTPQGDGTSIGYAFVTGELLVTCVFTAGTGKIDAHEPEWLSILGTLALRTSGSPTPS